MGYLHIKPTLNAPQIYSPQRPRTAGGFRVDRPLKVDRGVLFALAQLVVAAAD